MARARNIKPSLFKNELLGIADPLLTILFTGLWCLSDREGRLEDRPLRIKAEIFPYRDNLDINGYLTDLSRLGFIRRYTADNFSVIEILKFKIHQNPHHTEKASILPKYQENQMDMLAPLNNGHETVKVLLNPDSLILNPESNSTPRQRVINNELIEQAKGLIDYLNRKAGRNFEYGDVIIKPITARLKEYSVSQLFSVIDNKCAEWLNDDKMSYCLRPKTLFNATNCAQYIGEIGAPRVSEKPWFLVNSKIEAYGEASGIEKGTDWQLYKKQVLTSYGITVEQYKQAVAEWTKK